MLTIKKNNTDSLQKKYNIYRRSDEYTCTTGANISLTLCTKYILHTSPKKSTKKARAFQLNIFPRIENEQYNIPGEGRLILYPETTRTRITWLEPFIVRREKILVFEFFCFCIVWSLLVFRISCERLNLAVLLLIILTSDVFRFLKWVFVLCVIDVARRFQFSQ